MNVQGLCKKTVPKVTVKVECIYLGSSRPGREGFSQIQTSLKGKQINSSNVEKTVVL